MKVTYEHYRVSDIAALEYPLRGKPKINDVHAYSRKIGFLDRALQDLECKPLPRGGLTVCTIFLDDEDRTVSGDAYCSLADNFNYRIGRRISYGRAMKELEASDEI